MRINPGKFLSALSGAVIVLCVAFGAGMYSGVTRNSAYEVVDDLIDTFVLVFRERENIIPGGAPVHFLQPSRKEGSGVTINNKPAGRDVVFMSGFFDGGNELRVIRRDGTILARWPVSYSEHFPRPAHLQHSPATDRNIDIHGAVLNPDGSVVFNYEYGGTVKLSRCGETVWTLRHPTHHSVERSESGGYWIPGRNYVRPQAGDRFPPFTSRNDNVLVDEDVILNVTEDGKIRFAKSVPEILYENGLEALMTATGYNFSSDDDWPTELVHLNKIGELPSDMAAAFPRMEAGDLLLSIRQHNLLMVVDPDSWRARWLRTGPWIRQHDPEFNADGTITVFNNNTYRLSLGPNDRARLDIPRRSNIMRVSPSQGVATVVYGRSPEEAFVSVIRGKHDVVAGGGLLITDFEGGRAFEVDSNRNVVWEYINRFDENNVLEITEARAYPVSYFTVSGWNCR